jgi:hypothetical protein
MEVVVDLVYVTLSKESADYPKDLRTPPLGSLLHAQCLRSGMDVKFAGNRDHLRGDATQMASVWFVRQMACSGADSSPARR